MFTIGILNPEATQMLGAPMPLPQALMVSTTGPTVRTKVNMSDRFMHRIWLGSDMPERYKHYGELWKELNPDLTLWDWSEEEVMDSDWANRDVLHDLYQKSRAPGADMVAYFTQVADVVDYELVYRFGGWYFNTDLKPLKPLSTLEFDRSHAAFANEDDIHAVNMAMYAPQENTLFGKIIERLPVRYFGMPGAFMNATTGVQLIMEVMYESTWMVTRFHRDVFNPIHFTQFNYGEVPDVEHWDYPHNTIAVHEWAHRSNMRGQRVIES